MPKVRIDLFLFIKYLPVGMEAWQAGEEAWQTGEEAWRAGEDAWRVGGEAWQAGEEAWHGVDGDCSVTTHDLNRDAGRIHKN